ncbi:hypothetical protein NLI96_g13162 [Meripilus lineatus]|uniref:Uncharacterized protein n=1 Tax=Meripilus lineatus TaxID=2056292 RepID=A0AAD5UNM0_9APHY|nr:hypothetical protein NLI96_g13162 [Physisporinus lineatus]
MERPTRSSTPKIKREGDQQFELSQRSPELEELPEISSISRRNQGIDHPLLVKSRDVWLTPEPQTPSEMRRQRLEDSRIQFAQLFDGARQVAEEFTRVGQELIANHRYSVNEQAILAQSRDRAASAIAEANRMANLYSQASRAFNRDYQPTVSVDGSNPLIQVKPESADSSSTVRRVDYMSTPTSQRQRRQETEEELRDLALGQVPHRGRDHTRQYIDPRSIAGIRTSQSDSAIDNITDKGITTV